MKRVFKKNYLRTTVFASFVGLFFLILHNCSGKNVSSTSSGVGASIPIRVNIEADASYVPSTETTGLNLVTTATNVYAGFSGCTSGNTRPASLISSTLNLYKGDRNCLVKLVYFTLGSTTYSNAGVNAVDFTTWQVNDVATFQSTTNASNLIKVFVTSQVTASGVLTSDTVVYKFTDVSSYTTQNLSAVSVQTGVPLSTVSAASPNFTITQARFLSTNANGSGNLSFTLQCAQSLTGSSLPTYGCADATVGSNALLQSELDYIFIPDAYSQGAISWLQAQAAFVANTPASVGSFIVAPGQQDLNSNTLTNGGFYTSTLVTGTTPFSPNNLNYVLMVRRKNASGIGMSYLYFYVTLTATHSTSVSACGTSFGAGSGTAGDPYVVYDRTTLANTANCTSSSTYFIQVNNIDLGGSGNPWTPITLSGQYDGSGYKITGLYINSSSNSANIGLFGTINTTAGVSNLTLESVSITGAANLGALAGTSSGTISRVSSSGSIQVNIVGGNQNPAGGGLVGFLKGGTMNYSSSSVAMVLTPSSNGFEPGVGGLVGRMNDSVSSPVLVTDSFATGSLTMNGSGHSGYASLGALVGFINGASVANIMTVTKSYSTGNISVTNTGLGSNPYIGMVGQNYYGTVSQCFSKGNYTMSGTVNSSTIGGITAYASTGTFVNSYSMASLLLSGTTTSGSSATGGFIGQAFNTSMSKSYAASPSISSPYTNTKGFIGLPQGTTGISSGNTSYLYTNGSVPAQTLTNLVSYSSQVNMETQSNFSSFDFATPIWKMPSANPLSPNNPTTPLLSPVLAWQCGSNGIVCP